MNKNDPTFIELERLACIELEHADYEQRIITLEGELKRTQGELKLTRHYISQIANRLTAAEEVITKLTASKKGLPFHERMTPEVCNRVVKLRADLFDNGAETKKGAVRYKLKLFVWLDSTNGIRGHISPLMFYLTDRLSVDIRGGMLTHKKKPGIKGTMVVRDHEAACPVTNFHAFNDGKPLATVAIGDHAVWDLTEYEAITPSGGKEAEPIARWYWNKAKPAKGLDSTAT